MTLIILKDDEPEDNKSPPPRRRDPIENDINKLYATSVPIAVPERGALSYNPHTEIDLSDKFEKPEQIPDLIAATFHNMNLEGEWNNSPHVIRKKSIL